MSRIGPGRVSADQSTEPASALPQSVSLLPSYTLASLPAAGTAGRLARVTNVGGGQVIYLDNGSAWVQVAGDPLILAGTGPHAIGGATNPDAQLVLRGAFTGVGDAVAMFINSTITLPVNGIGFGLEIQPVFVLAGSGTHSSIATLSVNAPTASGTAAVTQGVTLNVAGAPTFGTTRYTALFGTGAVQFEGPNIAIGGNWDSTVQLRLLGNVAGLNQGIVQGSTLNPVANADAFGITSGIAINKAASGTHVNFDGVLFQAPTVGAGASSLTNVTTARFTGPPTGGTNNRTIWVTGGTTRLDGPLLIEGAVAIPAGGAGNRGIIFTNSAANFGIFVGSGVPTLTALQGSLYIRSDGTSTSTRAYINTDSAATWTAITTVA